MTDDDILNPRGYELQNLIGEGAYSKVRAAYRLKKNLEDGANNQTNQ